MWKLIKGIVHP